MPRKAKTAVRTEYFDVADKINKLLKSIALLYPDAAKDLDKLIGKYVSLHMELYRKEKA